MRINPEGMYNFKYDPKGLGVLHKYDMNPVIFILDIQGPYLLAVNVHWIPSKDRADFILDLQKAMGKTTGKGRRRERFRLVYKLLKQGRYHKGYVAIRKYIKTRMLALQEIPRDKWYHVMGVSKYSADVRFKANDYQRN